MVMNVVLCFNQQERFCLLLPEFKGWMELSHGQTSVSKVLNVMNHKTTNNEAVTVKDDR